MALKATLFKHIRGVTALRRCTLTTQATKAEDIKPGQTHFGYQIIDETEKKHKVHEVFETVAEKYDLMNDVMSMGVHRLWKDIFIQRLSPVPETKLLDMAGGTGDIAFRYIKYMQNLKTSGAGRSSVTICDINQNMLNVGKVRAQRHPESSFRSAEQQDSVMNLRVKGSTI